MFRKMCAASRLQRPLENGARAVCKHPLKSRELFRKIRGEKGVA